MTPSANSAFRPPLSPPDDSLFSPAMFSVLVCWTFLALNKKGVKESVGTGNESSKGNREDSNSSGGVDDDLKYGDDEWTVGENGGDNAYGDRVTSSTLLSGVSDDSGGSMATTNSTKSKTKVSAMQNQDNLAKNSREFQNGCDLLFSQKNEYPKANGDSILEYEDLEAPKMGIWWSFLTVGGPPWMWWMLLSNGDEL